METQDSDSVNSWTLTVEYDESGHAMITLPAELIASQGWQAGDVLTWVDLGDGTWQLTKA